ncbi:MAG: hypothetical protein CR986_05465 [Ignavibacteriae bacterium]|nr:MAG: hypothetical protein CR986_05465 [Ignavibacteriota bacterium]
MNFLNNLYVPETTFEFFIVKFGLFLSYLIVVPFVSVLFGTLLFSLIHVHKSNLYNNIQYLKFAEYISKITFKNIWTKLLLGLLPFFGFVFFYAQLFSNEVKSAQNLTFAFFLFVIGLLLATIYTKGYDRVDLKNFTDSINESKKPLGILVKIGWLGLLFIMLSSIILIGYSQNLLFPENSGISGLMNTIFTSANFLFIILFLTIAFALTSAVVLGRMNRTKENYEFKDYAKEFTIKTGTIFAIAQSIIFVAYLFSVNVGAFSISYLLTSFIVLVIMLIINVQFYLNYQDRNLKSTSIVFIFLLLFTVLLYNSQLASENARKEKIVKNSNEITIF